MTVRSESDLRLFGFLEVRWDGRDRRDRERWVERYDRYDGRGGFGGAGWWMDGWYAPSWGRVWFERDPLRYGPGRLSHQDLRRILGRDAFRRVTRSVPGGTGHLWGRVERFGPAGWSYTLEIWSRDRFVAALTDFDRDGWVDDVYVNGRYWR